jgi:uncharacterized protein (TIGR00369 family)
MACGFVGSGATFGTPAGRVAPLTWTGQAGLRAGQAGSWTGQAGSLTGQADFGRARMDQDLLDRAMAATTAEGTLAHTMGIKIVSASGSEVVATMPVAGNIQPFGLLHGGASCVLAETIGSLGAALHAGLGRVVVGIEISATHHRAATDGEVTAVATLAHGGRTLATYEIAITDSAGRRVCTARLTCLIRDQVPGNGAGRLGEGPGPLGEGPGPLDEPGATGS